MTNFTEKQERINDLIERGQKLKDDLLPLWSEYRRWLWEIKFDYGFRLPSGELHTPDIDFLLDVLTERSNQIRRMEDLMES